MSVGLWTDTRDFNAVGQIVAEAACSYKRPVFIGQTVDVAVRVARLGNKSMERGTQLTVGEDEMLVGHMVQVAYDYAAYRSIPLVWQEKVRAFESGKYQFPLSQTKIICLYS